MMIFTLQMDETTTFLQFFAEARAEISGPSEKYLKPGSVLRLTCRVVENIENPLYIFWYHNNRMINYDSHRGVNVSTEAGMIGSQFPLFFSFSDPQFALFFSD